MPIVFGSFEGEGTSIVEFCVRAKVFPGDSIVRFLLNGLFLGEAGSLV